MWRLLRSMKIIARRATWSLPVVPAAVVFMVLTVSSVVMWQWSVQNLRHEQQQEVEKRISMVEESILSRMRTSEMMLRAGTGLFDASESVGRDEWNRFFAKLRVEKESAGVSSIGYGPVVAGEERGIFEEVMRQEGLPSYTITPQINQQTMVPVMYTEHLDNTSSNTFGYDMYSDPVRREAMEVARDSGEIAMTGPVKFANSDTEGVLLYMPVYTRSVSVETVEERRQALHGYVYATIQINELLNTIAFEDDNNFGFMLTHSLSDSGPELFRSAFFARHPNLSAPVHITNEKIFGQNWTLTFYTTGNILPSTLNSSPLNVLAGGMVIAVFVGIAVYLSIAYRTRSFALAEERKLQQAKDGLLSLASHQLRTPATGVKQYVGMVLDGFSGKISKDQAALLRQAYQSNERQLQIINEFLYVAKLGSGSLVTSRHRFDLRPVILDVVDEMRSNIEERQHTISVNILQSAPIVADEHSVRMIIENLLSNAVKYTPKKGSITVSLKKRRGIYLLSVADTGVGIAEDDLPQLFKQFSRIPNELSHEVSGTGVGLYLAQQLAERNGGRIEVESEHGEGSTFTLSLPANL